MTNETLKPFGKWRLFFWPIYRFELKKLLPMLALFFLILFNYTILRDTKDTLIVTAPNSGAEAIPFLKVYGVLPAAILFMIVYSKMSNVLSKTSLFYLTVLPFVVYFGLFAIVIYPNADVLHPHKFCDYLLTVLPKGFGGLISIIRNWTFSTFYIASELWGSVCLSLLFWGFANDITKIGESKRFYNLFGLGANFSLLLAGTFIIWSSDLRRGLQNTGVDPWQTSLNWLMLSVVLSGIAIMVIYWWINKYVLSDARFYDASQQKKMKKTKPKMTMTDSIKYLLQSKHLGYIAIMVIGYGICINLVEVTWKSQLKLQYADPNAYSTFMGNFSRMTAVCTLFMMFFVTGNAVRKMGWKFAAMITPVVLLITGFAFFFFMIFSKNLVGITSILNMTPVGLAVLFGAMQNIMSKSAKYSLFDPTKEMAYIPLDQEQKVKGKAAIDVIGARLGKSGGALIQQLLILVLGSIAAMAPYISVLIFLIIGCWIFAVHKLDKSFKEMISPVEESTSHRRSGSVNNAKSTT